jgi:hypothetical protein
VLPESVRRIQLDTPIGWLLPRIALAGAADLQAAVELQKGFRLVPLSAWGAAEITRPKPDPADFPGLTQVELTVARDYFTTLNRVLRLSPRLGNPMNAAMAGWLNEISIDAETGFDWDALSPAARPSSGELSKATVVGAETDTDPAELRKRFDQALLPGSASRNGLCREPTSLLVPFRCKRFQHTRQRHLRPLPRVGRRKRRPVRTEQHPLQQRRRLRAGPRGARARALLKDGEDAVPRLAADDGVVLAAIALALVDRLAQVGALVQLR